MTRNSCDTKCSHGYIFVSSDDIVQAWQGPRLSLYCFYEFLLFWGFRTSSFKSSLLSFCLLDLPIAQTFARWNATEVGLFRLWWGFRASFWWQAFVQRMIYVTNIREVFLIGKSPLVFYFSISYLMNCFSYWLDCFNFLIFIFATLLLKKKNSLLSEGLLTLRTILYNAALRSSIITYLFFWGKLQWFYNVEVIWIH